MRPRILFFGCFSLLVPGYEKRGDGRSRAALFFVGFLLVAALKYKVAGADLSRACFPCGQQVVPIEAEFS